MRPKAIVAPRAKRALVVTLGSAAYAESVAMVAKRIARKCLVFIFFSVSLGYLQAKIVIFCKLTKNLNHLLLFYSKIINFAEN